MLRVGGNDSRRQTQARFSAHERSCRGRHGRDLTDLVLVDERTGQRGTAKVPSTPDDPARAVFAALEQAGCEAAEIACFVLGTTIATNCLLERTGQRTLYLTTAGFEDVPFIQRIDRRSLFDLQWRKSTPYVRRSDCIGVAERVTQNGEVRVELEESELERLVAEVRARAAVGGGVAVAINLLFSYVRPEHEQRLADALRAALPEIAVSCSQRSGADLARVRARQHRHRRRLPPATHGSVRRPARRRAHGGRASLPALSAQVQRGSDPRDAGVSPGGRLRALRPGGGPDRGQALRRGVRLHRRDHARHGRHERRRRRRRGRGDPVGGPVRARMGPADRRARRRPDHDRRRWQLRRGLRPGWAARGRPDERRRRPGAGRVREGRHGGDGHGREPRARTSQPGLFPRRCSAARRGARSSGGREDCRPTRVRGRAGRARDRRRRVREHGQRDQVVVRRPRPRLPPLRPDGVRRRRPASRGRARAPRGTRARPRATQPRCRRRRSASRLPTFAWIVASRGCCARTPPRTPSFAKPSPGSQARRWTSCASRVAALPTRLFWSRRAHGISGRTSSRRSPCRSTPAETWSRCWPSASIVSTKPCTGIASPMPWWSSCTSTRLQPNGARRYPRQRSRRAGQTRSACDLSRSRPVRGSRRRSIVGAPWAPDRRSPGRPSIEEVDSTTIVLPGQVARAHMSGALFIEHEAGRGNRAGEAQELSRA